MLGHRSAFANFVTHFAVISLVLLTATLAGAQTPSASIDKLAVEASHLELESGSKTSKASVVISGEEATKATAESVKSETEAVKANTDPATSKPTLSPPPPPPPSQCPANTRTIKADVVAIPKAIMLNRMGASIPNAFVFALRSDTVGSGSNIQLRPGRRARPIVLRADVGDCLKITFTNAIPPASFTASTPQSPSVGTQEVSLHIQGMEWASGSGDDGSFVGKNSSSLASPSPAPVPPPMPPQTQTYTLFVKNEGTFLLYTMGDTTAEPIGQLSRGLFGALNTQPAGAEWYRSQVTAEDLSLATYKANQVPPGSLNCPPPGNICKFVVNGQIIKVIKTATGQLNTLDNHPLINYAAVYPAGSKWPDGTPIPPNTPILKMLDAGNNIVHTDLTAIITGPNAGRFPGANGNPNKPDPPCNAENNPALPPGPVDPLFCANPAAPDRKQPYREVTIMYHEVGQVATQAFPIFTDPTMLSTVNAGFDGFAINYGTGGIGAEIYANRIGVGPMGDCVDCKFEEFFLSAWSVGDPAMLVDWPANSPCTINDLSTGNNNCVNPTGTRTPATGFPYTMKPVAKATKALFPDDPSNVYHSYINDHIKFRILHGGTIATHVHHQHAHQWLQSPNSDEGAYLDSQMISPGASYTLEMTYNGSGNRNKVVGDSIFHCHFYPHFAAGMWAMWRTHDVFEAGTFVYPKGSAKDGQVVTGSRALPDGEIIGGAPNPALVPLPTIPMAPLPAYAQIQNGVKVNGVQTTVGGQVVFGGTCLGNKINGLDVIGGCVNNTVLNGTAINVQFNGTTLTGQFQPSAANALLNPGYPFFIPGIAGARAPHPPFDFAPDGAGGWFDGGLPRHVVAGGSISYEKHDQFDWSKDLATISAVKLPEEGTDVEKAAISYFHKRCYPTFFPNGTPGSCPPPVVTIPQMTQNTPPTGFVLNGLPLGPQPGAPFADPGVDDNGNPINVDPVTHNQRTRRYKAAAIQLNVTLNKQGWHFPQQRMLALWNDVKPTLAYTPGGSGRPPEPLFFRGNSGDIIEYWHTNLVPNYYLVDDFQVRTPTDILGQHIHLVKFDVTSSDGAGNGFNYEDGTFSPDEVREVIDAINNSPTQGFVNDPNNKLKAKAPPAEICSGPQPPSECTDEWKGAQTTVQRWYLDPLVDNSNVDRTLRTVFTHDHFGPSTHQQAGLYAGLVVEPKDSSWRNSEDGTPMGGGPITSPPVRPDGGPTSWKADILTRGASDSYREFVLEFQDLQLAYDRGSRKKPSPDKDKGWRDASFAVNPTVFPEFGQVMPRLISTGNDHPITGTTSVNYYNEPIAWRIGQRVPLGNDLSYAYDNVATLKTNPNFPNPQNPNPDPLTPLMRAYQNDNVQVRVLVGAHVFAHQFNLEGPTWFAEPSWKNSGYRSTQAMGLSEHFELLFKVPSSSAPIPVPPATTVRQCPDKMSDVNCVDYFYSPSLDETGIAQGLWGIFRSYDPTAVAKQLQPLPNNPVGPGTNVTYNTCPGPPNRPADRVFNVTAVTAQKALANQAQAPGQLVFNNRGAPADFISSFLGAMYVRSEDLDSNGALRPGVPIEPLILRANAGDCIEVNLTSAIAIDPPALVLGHNFNWSPPFNITVPDPANPGQQMPAYNSRMSYYVGLHPQLLSFDAATSYGLNVGWNSKGRADQFVRAGEPPIKYRWYAGKIERDTTGNQVHTPVEFGSLNLFPSDPLFQHVNGLFGSMIIEPRDSTWVCGEVGSTRSCDPPPAGPSVPPTSRASATVTKADGTKFREFALMISDSLVTSSTSSAVNYRTEPKSFRYPNVTPANDASSDFSCMTSNLLVGPTPPAQVGDPQTPIFTVVPPIFTAALGDQVRFRMTHPFGTGDSQVFTVHGHDWQRNPYSNNSREIGNNKLSQWLGSRDNHGSTDHFDLVIDKAGGTYKKPGDYLYTVYLPDQSLLGAWGIFRVGTSAGPAPNGVCPQQQPAAQPAVLQPALKKNDLERFRRPPANSPAKP